uniref:Uncharacterized protein n=1 Tax=viral metagenome TaxID=1070528 RepID=A0A6M3L3B0_9ZZZZ
MTEEATERAINSGWTPQEDFKGDPEKWLPAEVWNERADTMLPLIKAERKKTAEENQRLKSEISTTQQEIAQLKRTMKQIVNVSENVTSRAYEKAKETIRKEKQAAVENSDGAAFAELEKQELDLDKARPVKVDMSNLDTPSRPTDSGPLASFKSRNVDWYEKDEELTGYAQGLAVKLQKSGVVDATEQLKQVEAGVKKRFPEQFGNSRREEETVTGPTTPPPRKKGSSFTWTPEATEMFNMLKRDDPKYTKEQYIKDSE